VHKLAKGLSVLAVVLGVASSAAAAPLFVANPGFENPVLADSGAVFVIPGWVSIGDAGVFDPHAAAYLTGAPEGENVAFSQLGGPDWGGPIVSQVLGDALTANTLYTLTMLVGNRLDAPFAGYEIGLYAGGSLLANDFNTLAPGDGQFLLSTVQYFAAANDPLLGSLLEIQFRSLGRQANFDDVKVDAVTRQADIPEPATLALVGAGALGALLRRRRAAKQS